MLCVLISGGHFGKLVNKIINLQYNYNIYFSLSCSPNFARGKSTFFIYSCYAWGCPAIIAAICRIAENHQNPSTLLYEASLVGLIGLLLSLNMVLFMWTSVKIFLKKRKLKVLSGRENRIYKATNTNFQYVKP